MDKAELKNKVICGHEQNTVLTQIWIALCLYLLLAYIKFQLKLDRSMQQLLRLL